MVFKDGRFGRFIACSGYPECKTTRPITIGIKCPQEGCGGELTERRSKRGKLYYGCANYPACKFVAWQRPVASPCPKCASPFLLARANRGKRFLACWREGCDYRRDADDAQRGPDGVRPPSSFGRPSVIVGVLGVRPRSAPPCVLALLAPRPRAIGSVA